MIKNKQKTAALKKRNQKNNNEITTSNNTGNPSSPPDCLGRCSCYFVVFFAVCCLPALQFDLTGFRLVIVSLTLSLAVPETHTTPHRNRVRSG